MSKDLICRVIMVPDATVHIAFGSRGTIGCTANCLSNILGNPISTSIRNIRQEDTTSKVNPMFLPLESIPGLTLLKVFSDAEVVCVFPKLFQTLFSNITDNATDEIIDLTDYINDLENYDEKHLLMKFFHSFTNEFSLNTKVQVPLEIEEQDKLEILSETYHSSFLPLIKMDEKSIIDTDSIILMPGDAKLPLVADDLSSGRTMTLKEAAAFTGYGESTLHKMKHNPDKLKLATPIGVKPALITLNEAKRLKALREGKEKPSNKLGKSDRKTVNKLTENGINSLRKKLCVRSGLSEEIINFIKSKEEYNFYCNKGYKEVDWKIRRALIVDVDFNYTSPKDNITNAARMAKGDPPIVSGTDDVVYIVHHIGQEARSPFAIFNPLDHQKYDGQLHSKKKNLTYKINPFGKYEECISEDKHGSNFKTQKAKFWKEYYEQYVAAGNFKNIQGYLVSDDLSDKQNKIEK